MTEATPAQFDKKALFSYANTPAGVAVTYGGMQTGVIVKVADGYAMQPTGMIRTLESHPTVAAVKAWLEKE